MCERRLSSNGNRNVAAAVIPTCSRVFEEKCRNFGGRRRCIKVPKQVCSLTREMERVDKIAVDDAAELEWNVILAAAEDDGRRALNRRHEPP